MLFFKIGLCIVFTTPAVLCCGNLDVTNCFDDMTKAVDKFTEQHPVSWIFEGGKKIWNICWMYSEGMACMHKKLSVCKYLHRDVQDNLDIYLEIIVKNGVVKMCDNPSLVQRYVENARCIYKSRYELKTCLKMGEIVFKKAPDEKRSISNSDRFCRTVEELVDCGKAVTANLCGHDVGDIFKDIVMNYMPEKSRGECLNRQRTYVVIGPRIDKGLFPDYFDNVNYIQDNEVPIKLNYDHEKNLDYDSDDDKKEEEKESKNEDDKFAKEEADNYGNEEDVKKKDDDSRNIFINLTFVDKDTDTSKAEKKVLDKTKNAGMLVAPLLQLQESSMHSWKDKRSIVDSIQQSEVREKVQMMSPLTAISVHADKYADDADFAFSVLMLSVNDVANERQVVNGVSDLRLYIGIFFCTVGLATVYVAMVFY